jgi:type I restriction enzyme S subunit
MAKIDRLIEELCPNGVEYVKVGDVCEILTGGEAPNESVKGKEPLGEYIYPIYSNGIGENAVWGFSKTFRVDVDAVTFSSIGTIGYPTIRKKNFTPIIRLKVIYPKNMNTLNIGFLKYSLEMVDFNTQKSSVANINTKMVRNEY